MSLATIRIKSYDYLQSQRHISPNVNDDMLRMAGQTIRNVDLNNLCAAGYVSFKGWSWRSEWFEILENETTPLTQEQLNLPHTLTTILNEQDFPEELEYIQIVSDRVKEPTQIELSQFTLSIIESTSTNQLYFKFKGATAYNVSDYLGMSSRRLSYSPEKIAEHYGNGRNKEILVARTLKALHNGVESWADIYRQAPDTLLFAHRNESILYRNGRFDVLNGTGVFAWSLPAFLSTNSYELRTMLLFFATIFNATILPVGTTEIITWDKLDLLNPPFDDSKAYLKRYDGLLPLDRASIEGTIPVVKSKILGFYMAAQDSVEEALFKVKFQTTWCRVTQNNVFVPFDASLEDLFKQAQLYNYLDRYRPVGVRYKGDVYHPHAIDIIKEREEILESLGIYADGPVYARHDVEEYDFEPEITFFGDASEPHFGVELEVDKGGSDPDLSIIEKVLGVDFAYYMRDGSLDDGFEIATMPATLDYHINHKRRYETAFKLLEQDGYRSHDTSSCGLHIHFDRTALGATRATQNLKASFLALILEKNWNQVIKFSRRDFRRLEQWAKNQKLVGDIYHDDDEASVVRKFNNKYANGDKYNALNCNHSHTFELRIFRGTLKANTYIATLQFVSNLVSVARECKTLDQAQRVKFEDIINYKSYDELNAYIAERNLNIEGGEQ